MYKNDIPDQAMLKNLN
jgi:hypothetical protein